MWMVLRLQDLGVEEPDESHDGLMKEEMGWWWWWYEHDRVEMMMMIPHVSWQVGSVIVISR